MTRGADRGDLALQEREAACDLVRFRVAVPGGRHFTMLAMYHLAPAAVEALFDHLGEEPAGAPDEGFPLAVLVAARAFADEHEVGAGVADAEHDGAAVFREAAAGAVAEVVADRRQRFGRGFAAGGGPGRGESGEEVRETAEQAEAGGEFGAESRFGSFLVGGGRRGHAAGAGAGGRGGEPADGGGPDGVGEVALRLGSAAGHRRRGAGAALDQHRLGAGRCRRPGRLRRGCRRSGRTASRPACGAPRLPDRPSRRRSRSAPPAPAPARLAVRLPPGARRRVRRGCPGSAAGGCRRALHRPGAVPATSVCRRRGPPGGNRPPPPP